MSARVTFNYSLKLHTEHVNALPDIKRLILYKHCYHQYYSNFSSIGI